MEIENNSVVAMNYTLTDDNGQVIDTSEGREPLVYLQGAGNIIVGLEKEMLGKKVDDSFSVRIAPEEGYGVRMDQLVQKVPHSTFQGVDKVEVGMRFQGETNQGPILLTVTEVNDDEVTIDGNHELAGVFLNFAVTVVSIRAATEAEIQQGHV